jgi:hypothetical protein
MRRLDITNVDDKVIRENLKQVDNEFASQPLLSGQWESFIRDFPTAGTYTLSHHLSVKPMDVIVTKQVGTITFNYDLFTTTTFSITVSAGAKARFIIGRITT